MQEILDDDPAFADHPALREAVARRLDESEREFLEQGVSDHLFGIHTALSSRGRHADALV